MIMLYLYPHRNNIINNCHDYINNVMRLYYMYNLFPYLSYYDRYGKCLYLFRIITIMPINIIYNNR